MMSSPRSVANALAELGVRVERTIGEEMWALCPMHLARTGREDTHPSWSINEETGIHHCFSCGYGGSFLWLVMDLQFPDDAWSAQRWIIRNGVELLDPSEIEINYGGEANRRREEPAEEERRYNISEASLSLFVLPLEAPLDERNITREAASFYGLLWDISNHGWIMPIRLPGGRLLGWQFKSKRQFENYPPGVSKKQCVFGLEKLGPGQRAYLVEAPLDTATMRSAGVMGGVATMGSHPSDEQMRAILARTDDIVLAYDNDEAGRVAITELVWGKYDERRKRTSPPWVNRFRRTGIWPYPVDPHRKDPGEMTTEEIRYAAAHPISTLEVERPDVYRRLEALPGTRRQQGAGPRSTPRRLPDGVGKDRDLNLRNRRTGRGWPSS